MKYVIWGAGIRGRRIFQKIDGEKCVEAFIDNDPMKIGQMFCDKEIISFSKYQSDYGDCTIIISCIREKEIIDILKERNVLNYVLLSECPGEFQGPSERNILKEFFDKKVLKSKRYAVYGNSLYAVILIKWLQELLGYYVPLLFPESSKEKDNQDWIKAVVKEYETLPYTVDICQMYDEIFVTKESDLEQVKQSNQKKCQIVNVYDCADQIEEYYNPCIEQYHNKYMGKRCFIVATGPSLRMDDLEILRKNHEKCISMNEIWKAFSQTKWRPDFYIADDYRCMEDAEVAIDELPISVMFLGDTSEKFWSKEHKNNVMKHHFVYEYADDRLPKFSEDFSRKCYMGSTVTYSCIQLAVYMGFQEIYLLGVDFSYAGNDGMTYAHFFKEKQLISIGFEKQVYLAYVAAENYSEQRGIQIKNATRGGKLEVFERVDFDSLFD